MSRTIDAALDAVLRRAIAAKDDATIEAYREIYQKMRPTKGPSGHSEQVHAALRLGLLLGLEVRRQAATAPATAALTQEAGSL